MRDLWDGLPAGVQDVAVLALLLLPLLVTGLVVTRGFAPWPLARAILWRFRWPVLIFALLIAVAVGTGIGLIAQERALRQGTAAAADPFDLVIGAPGSEITLLLAAVFLQPSDVSLLDGAAYEAIAQARGVAFAAPLAFGDSVDGAPVVGTTAEFVTHLSGGALAEGRIWAEHGEAVVGAGLGLPLGAGIEPAHGTGPSAESDAHAGEHFTVTGRLPPTGTPWDRAVLVPVETVWEVHGLAAGHAPERAEQVGPPFDAAYFPGTPAVVVRPESLAAAYALRSQFNGEPGTMAFFPGAVLSQFYGIMGDVRAAMSLMALVSQGLVAVSVLLGLFILSRLTRRQMALLRALGAPARFVLAVVWCHGTALLAAGTVLGVALGWGAAAVLSRIIGARTEILLHTSLGWTEVHLAAAFLSLASLAALLPAAAALRAPVIEGLRA
ncbi:FtsX-like permease family protein [Oceaniglobus roseus]|uniref:FtsX-like permease family protein n=1 Tax=Oceaniglobus roseus TaxID=1737570 RepID=UPI000C7EDE3C|nr:FtsX-like permease family protein [Kandeliimicrobium roseum]